jgi:hypothetical protein
MAWARFKMESEIGEWNERKISESKEGNTTEIKIA